jgi:predicted RNA methylase
VSVLGKAAALVRREGVVGSLRHAASIVHWKYVVYRDDTRFDRRYGVETSRLESDYLARVRSDHVAGAVPYEASKQRDFERMLRLIPVDRRAVTFIDAGCGKGRVLLFAALDGFEHIVGVEFGAPIADVARRNVEIFRRRTSSRASITVLTQDIATFEFPDTDVVLYMYNPFGADLMQIVVDRVLEFARRSRHRVHIAYRNPKCAELFVSHPSIEIIKSDPAYAVYRVREHQR